MIADRTDTSIPAILTHIDRQLEHAEIVTLTRGQITALLIEAGLPPPMPSQKTNPATTEK